MILYGKKKFSKLEPFHCGICNITDINHLKYLRRLIIDNLTINNNEIKDIVNIQTLYIRNNYKITNINHITNLIELRIFGISSLMNDRIRGIVNTQILNINNNFNITDINHMTN